MLTDAFVFQIKIAKGIYLKQIRRWRRAVRKQPMYSGHSRETSTRRTYRTASFFLLGAASLASYTRNITASSSTRSDSVWREGPNKYTLASLGDLTASAPAEPYPRYNV